MTKARVVIDTQNQKIKMEDIPHIRAEDNPRLKDKMTEVIIGKDHSIPPRSEMKVVCTVNSSYEHGLTFNNNLIIYNSESKFHAMDGVIKLQDNGTKSKECFAIVLNMGNEAVHLPKNMVLGKLEGLDKDGFRPIESLLQVTSNERVIMQDTSHLKQVKLENLPFTVRGKYQSLLLEYADIFFKTRLTSRP